MTRTSVHGFFGLQEALREFEEAGGQPARRRRYAALSARLRAQLPLLGAGCLLAAEECASMLTAFRLPSGVSYAYLHDGLKQAGFHAVWRLKPMREVIGIRK